MTYVTHKFRIGSLEKIHFYYDIKLFIVFKGIHEVQSEISFRFDYLLVAIKRNYPVGNFFFRQDEASAVESVVSQRTSR